MMASLYQQLMAAKGAPQADRDPNSTQMREAPMSLRSALRKYAEGGNVTGTAPDYSRAYDALGGAGVVNDLRNQFLNMGVDENTIGSIFSKYYAPEAPQPQTITSPEPTPFMPPENVRQPEPIPYPFPKKPAYEPNPYDEFKEKMSRSTEPAYEPNPYDQFKEGRRLFTEPAYEPTPFMPPENVPQVSYIQMPDGSVVEIGYDGNPISDYTQEQLDIHNQVIGKTKPDFTYQYDGNTGRMIKVPIMADPVYEPMPYPVPETPAYEFQPQPEPMPYPVPETPAYEFQPQPEPMPFMPPVNVPQTSYRQMPDGSIVEIGYDGDPISGYTKEQREINDQVTGRTKPDFTYQYDGNTGRMIKVPISGNYTPVDYSADAGRNSLLQDQQRLMQLVNMLKGK
jgi:hypothetical protein